MMNVSFAIAIDTNDICMQLVYVIDIKCIIAQLNCKKKFGLTNSNRQSSQLNGKCSRANEMNGISIMS